MGMLVYDSSAPPILVDDAALSHLKVVMLSKLRRGESFAVSWKHPASEGGGRSTIWVNQAVPLRFVFDETDPPELDQQWLAEMAESAAGLGGIALGEAHVAGGDPRQAP
ncbi:hypothetical protein [Microbacterium sp. NPDC096154]|uniref:DUF7882 family protein n=1 Tax=Microbacterium sp. NPDC096154 TaxID=3155549 RepID=UPI003322465A